MLILDHYLQDPPKYEYGYSIADEKGTGQGKLESRDGEHAQGRYEYRQKHTSFII